MYRAAFYLDGVSRLTSVVGIASTDGLVVTFDGRLLKGDRVGEKVHAALHLPTPTLGM